ncbi:Protein kinase domain [Trinorchestia longiramus]|nr:Protein kinase domain [Trinorchestia longiramus]
MLCLLLPLLLACLGAVGAPSVPVSSEGGLASSGRPVCHRSRASVILKEEGDHILPGGDRVLCASSSDSCFSFWTYDNTTHRHHVKWLAQGCFSSSDACEQNRCRATRESPKNSFFCCCRGDLCNGEVLVPPDMGETVVSTLKDQETSSSSRSLFIQPPYWIAAVVAAILLSSVTGAVSVALWRRYQRKASLQHEFDVCSALSASKGGAPGEGPPQQWQERNRSIDIRNVELTHVIGKGRFGCVYKAMAGAEEVVVKVFSEAEKESYSNELFIYSHPFMEHPNLLTCLGYGSVGEGRQYGLVLPYCSGGRLTSYLTHHTLSFSQLCRIASTATRGLAHLHAPITAHGLEKPSMSHRDFNSRNLVLREDLSCVVIDLGLAVCVKGASHSRPGRPYTQGTPPALNEAGSLRYMAPELLEGAVNLSECEAALRQIDVYALALVLWECLSRCPDLTSSHQPYALPYQKELGTHVQLNQMIEFVVKDKRRPQFPEAHAEITRDCLRGSVEEDLENESTETNSSTPALTDDQRGSEKKSAGALLALRLLRDTIEECWDADAEARLSAQCVFERLAQLPQLYYSTGGKETADKLDSLSKKFSCDTFISQSNEALHFTNDSHIDFNSPDLELPAYTSDCETRLSFSSAPNIRQPRQPADNCDSLILERRKQPDCQVPLLDHSSSSGQPDTNPSRLVLSQGFQQRKESSSGCVIANQYVGGSSSRSNSNSSGATQSCERPGWRDESSTRTLDTLLSPSVSGQPHLMLITGQIGNNDFKGAEKPGVIPVSGGDGPLCTASVVQKGSSVPVCVLQSPSSPSSGELAPIIGNNSASSFWSKLKEKFRPGKRKSILVSNDYDIGVVPELKCKKLPGAGRQASLYCPPDSSSHLLQTSACHDHETDPPTCNLETVDSRCPASSLLSEHLNSTLLTTDSKTRISSCHPHGSSPHQANSDLADQADQSCWTHTVPLRRHPAGKKRPSSRPVSLEISATPEKSSPLSAYLSTSCNFRTPDEVVLRKSKTRVKTPRHPPLPRISLNSDPTV